MPELDYGRLLAGSEAAMRASLEQFNAQPVDQEMLEPQDNAVEWRQTTLARPVSVSGPGTFLGKANRTLEFVPFHGKGWWFDRTDLPGSLPIGVSVLNVWTTARNIVLSSGSPHNYMRMVEHIVALKYLGLDNVMIRMNSGDPPLFERSSMDLVEAVERAGIVSLQDIAEYRTVKEPVSIMGPGGAFLIFLPAEDGFRGLTVDCAIDFPTAIGRQRIRFDVNRNTFHHGAICRTTSGKCSIARRSARSSPTRATWATRSAISWWPVRATMPTSHCTCTMANRSRRSGIAPCSTCLPPSP